MPSADSILIELAGEPKGKGALRHRIVRSRGCPEGFAHGYTPKATNDYMAALRFAAQQAMGGRELIRGAVTVKVMAFFMPPVSWSKRKRADALTGVYRHTKAPDCDNLCKMLDALKGVVWVDDAQVDTSVIMKRFADPPYLCIEIVPVVP